MDIKILREGPLADEINQANATITHNLRLLAATEGDISDALAGGDVEALMALRSRRDALTSVVAAMRRDRDALNAKRSAQTAREAAEAREAAFAALPERESCPDFADPNTIITRVRFRI